jgi:hypothetical protein
VFVFAGLLGLSGFLLSPVAAQGRAQLVTYRSALDDSPQTYGVYIPHSPAPTSAGYPAVMHMHGYGWSVNASFSEFQRQWADNHGWILINLNARGPQFYDGVGDVESRKVLRDAHQRFGLDRQRVYLTGGSMGGTGAFRLGIRYPDLFAASVGVDGWSDFREWHHHWYARTDQRNAIEEFRRPLLEAASPLYHAGRARWATVQASVSGRDEVVLPVNGLLLYNELWEYARQMPGAYEARLYLDYDKGHGGSNRLDQIYALFAQRLAVTEPDSFRCESSVLTHGALYWGRMDRQRVQGAKAALESEVSGNVLYVFTHNLSAFSLFPQASGAAGYRTVRVVVDGFPCYEGAPRTLHLISHWSPAGALWGWEVGEAPPAGKSAQLEGPLGEAFKHPFVVVYGTAGSAAETVRNRQEADDFARGWNNFMIHEQVVSPLPEEALDPPDLQTRGVILFGTRESSRLLSQAYVLQPPPVEVRREGIVVRDPQGDRDYRGEQFGAFVCTPNPLSEGQTYLVVLRGQWATKPDGSARQGLEYDLEKLPWAYPDYVVFNTDQSQLPHVLNVNNKPPVTCYEAGYFVEAGYFDQDWQPYRAATLDRVLALKLPVSRIQVAAVEWEAGESDRPQVRVLVVDSGGAPVNQARVTVCFAAEPPVAVSAVTGTDGVARFPVPVGRERQRPTCQVLNVMATGAVYDYPANLMTGTHEGDIRLRVQVNPPGEGGQGLVTVEAGSPTAATLEITAQAGAGSVSPAVARLVTADGSRGRVVLHWDARAVPPGGQPVRVTARALGTTGPVAVREVRALVGYWPQEGVRLCEVKATDIAVGQPYAVTARLLNETSTPVTVKAWGALLQVRRGLKVQEVTLAPGVEQVVTWQPEPGASVLPQGLHTVRVGVAGYQTATGAVEFAVK